jgi:hypothetical protein
VAKVEAVAFVDTTESVAAAVHSSTVLVAVVVVAVGFEIVVF